MAFKLTLGCGKKRSYKFISPGKSHQNHCTPDHHYPSPFFFPPWMERKSSRMERTSRSTNSRRILRMAVRCSGVRVIPARSSSSLRSCTTGSMATTLPSPYPALSSSPINGSPSPSKSQAGFTL